MSQEKEYGQLVAELKDVVNNRLDGTESTLNEYKGTLDTINERMDAIELEVKNIPAKPSEETVKSGIADEFKQLFTEFAQGNRKGLMAEREFKSAYHPAATKSDNIVRFDFAAAGALLLPAQISADIIKDVTERTPVLALARVTSTDRAEYKRRVRKGTPGGRWLSEATKNQKTKPEYAEIAIPLHKWAAQYGWSFEQANDTGYNLVSELMEAYREDFEVDFGNAFLQGDAIGKPTGMVGRIDNFDATQLAITTSDLIRIQESRKEVYQASASWLFTRKTRAYIRTLVLSATNGLQYTWEPDFQRRGPTMLLGNPVYIAREGDLAGRVAGNFTAGEVYLIYGDFRQGYEVTMGTQMYAIDDPYSEADSFVRNLHLMSRVGGNVIKPEALVQATAAGS